MPPFKEVHYFDHLYLEEVRKWTHGHIKNGVKDSMRWHVKNDKIYLEYFKYLTDIALVEPFTEDWYYRCFNRDSAKNKKLGDITPEYCTIPEDGINYIKNLLGENVKIIYIIRDPLSRALSQLRMNVTRQGKENDGLDVWNHEASEPVLLQRGDYATFIPRWKKLIDSSNILFIPFKKIKSSPKEILEEVERFIGVSNFSFSGLNNKVHKTKSAEVPESIIAKLEQAVKPQYDFLKNNFDSDFVNNI